VNEIPEQGRESCELPGCVLIGAYNTERPVTVNAMAERVYQLKLSGF
jgi:hypothetical protein